MSTAPLGFYKATGDGYVQSEAVVAVYITKRSLAKRCYATVLNTATNTDGHKENGFTYPSGDAQAQLMRRTYAEAGIRAEDVYYVEAHGTGTAAGDVQELEAITSVFCKNRPITTRPLLIGSVKSNMGHAEAAAGICSVIKILLSIQHGQIPANLHYEIPNPRVPALVDGRLQVVDRLIKVTGDIFGVCASGLGGANVHVILRGQQPQMQKSENDSLPVLVPISARTEDGIEWCLRKLEQNLDLGTVRLLSKIHELPLVNHKFRSYVLIHADQKVSLVSKSIEATRPLWLVFPGIGSQWAGMGREIMQIDSIRRSLQISASILRPFDLDLIDMVTNQNEKGLQAFGLVAFTAVGIALVDFLKSLDLAPEGYIGHSSGDLLCAYLDGCWTQEEVLLCQYHKETLLNDIGGDCAMASVGLTWDEAMSLCPKGIYPACHNAKDNVTLSGCAVELVSFAKNLELRGVFAKMVPSGGVAYHSPHISHLATRLEPFIKEGIKGPRLKSNKWISTAIVEDPSDTAGKYVTAEYFLHQFVSPVQFHPAVKKIPWNAVVLELGSHSLFQNILKRSLPSSVTLIPTMRRNADDNVRRLYSAVGSLFVNGLQPKFSAILPQLKNGGLLASNPKLSISSLVQWDHSKKYLLFDFVHKGKAQHVTKVSLLDTEWAFLSGHNINGQVVFPVAGYIVLVWKAYASLHKKPWRSLGLKFENIILHRATVFENKSVAEFAVNILESSCCFEILESKILVVTGRVEIYENDQNFENKRNVENCAISNHVLKSEDVYKDFRLRGYEYKGDFHGILSSGLLGDCVRLRWNQEWIALLDTILQVSTISLPISAGSIYLPTSINSVTITPEILEISKTPATIPVSYCSKTNSISTPGVQINGIKFSSVPRRQRVVNPSIQNWAFVPYMDTNTTETPLFDDVLKIMVDIVLENTTTKTLSVAELCSNANSTILEKVCEISKLLLEREAKATTSKAQLIVLQNLKNFDEFRNSASTLDENGFILIILKTFVSELEIMRILMPKFGLLLLVANKNLLNSSFYLLRKPPANLLLDITIPVSNINFDWVEPLQQAISKGSLTSRIWLTSNDPDSGLVGFVNCLRKEGIYSIRCLISHHTEVTEQMKESDMVMNVFHGGKHGSYRSLNIPEISKTSSAHAYLNVLKQGDLSSAAWIEAPVQESLPNRTQISVHYAALNSRDIMLATGKLSPRRTPQNAVPQECVLGLEYSGIDPQGNHVMGLVPSKSLSTHVQGDPSLMWTVPHNWSLAEASTVPVAYATAYYALMMRGNLQRGESVLITSGTGGVGQAAIAIALSLNCKIYTTVGSHEKKMWLAKTFPQIDKNHILSSQSTEFGSELLKFTHHRGVDVVLNSLSEEKLQTTLSAVANGGRFLEIGKFDLSQNTTLGMELFLKNIAFHGILDALFSDSEHTIFKKQKLKGLINDGIQSGVVQPLPIKIFESAHAREAFRFMASGKHMGKVVLRVRSEGGTTPLLKVIPRTYFDPHKMYVLVGGLGGFGLAVTAWLISRGARNVALVGRSGVTTGYQQLQISRWRRSGVNVLVSKAALQNPQECETYLQECEAVASVGGIFNLAMVVKDGLFENQNAENFQSAVTPKYRLTQNLDLASRKLCPQLDHFIGFSSGTADYGNAGQSNYGFGNSAMERLIAQRRADGFPALSIAFGPIDEVGFVQNFKGGVAGVRGALRQPLASCLKHLDHFLHPSFQSDTGLVSCIVLSFKGENTTTSQKESTVTSLTQRMAETLGMSAAEFESKKDSSLGELGLDSLMVMEAKQILAEFGKVGLTTAQIRRLNWANIQEFEKARA